MPRRPTCCRDDHTLEACDFDAARERRDAAAEQYRPDPVRLLIVAEAPPDCVKRYFYFEDVRRSDDLFRYVVRTVLGVEPSRSEKPAQLAELKRRGVFLVDLKLDPKWDDSDLSRYVDDLVKRAASHQPGHVIVIKTNVYDLAYRRLREAGLDVANVRMPFPGSGRQTEFQQRMNEALELIGWER